MFVEMISGLIMLLLVVSFTIVAIKLIPKEEETKEFAPYFYLGISLFRFFSLGIVFIVSAKFFDGDYIILAAMMTVVFIIGVAVELYMKKKMAD